MKKNLNRNAYLMWLSDDERDLLIDYLTRIMNGLTSTNRMNYFYLYDSDKKQMKILSKLLSRLI